MGKWCSDIWFYKASVSGKITHNCKSKSTTADYSRRDGYDTEVQSEWFTDWTGQTRNGYEILRAS